MVKFLFCNNSEHNVILQDRMWSSLAQMKHTRNIASHLRSLNNLYTWPAAKSKLASAVNMFNLWWFSILKEWNISCFFISVNGLNCDLLYCYQSICSVNCTIIGISHRLTWTKFNSEWKVIINKWYACKNSNYCFDVIE